MVTPGPAESACEHRLQICITDMISPGGNTVAGRKLQENMDELRVLGCTNQDQVTQNVSAMNIPEKLKIGTKVFLVGSPADHDPDGNGHADQCGGCRKFKEDIFFSMCWHTPAHTACLMTYSQRACTVAGEGYAKGLVWWTVLQEYPARTFMLAPAWFQSYRPSYGLADSVDILTDSVNPDTMVAIFAPASFMPKLQWNGEVLDVAATVIAWLSESGKLVTFGAYTAELELDIARRANVRT